MKTQKTANTDLYKNVLWEMKDRGNQREESCGFAVNQVRNKFKVVSHGAKMLP